MTKSDVTPQDDPGDGEYHATADELRMIDAALASIDRGEVATESEVKAVFARFLRE
ncbi:putative transcriptional regulator [Bradyrhizobium sp. USDA 377]